MSERQDQEPGCGRGGEGFGSAEGSLLLLLTISLFFLQLQPG